MGKQDTDKHFQYHVGTFGPVSLMLDDIVKMNFAIWVITVSLTSSDERCILNFEQCAQLFHHSTHAHNTRYMGMLSI